MPSRGRKPRDEEKPRGSWAERAADRSPAVRRSRTRGVEKAKQIVEAARRLVAAKGTDFTTQQLVREAGVAIQTFYNYFPSKDQVLLSLMEELINESCAVLERRGRELPDPVSRLRYYIRALIDTVGTEGAGGAHPRFVTTEHWRLHQLYPEELSHATRRYAELLIPEIRAAAERGLLRPVHEEYDAWLVTQLIISVYHYYAYAPLDAPAEVLADRVWAFCLAALGGTPELSEGPI
ncbi:TetR family transcriptional regulator [Actinomadura sp. LD22]|uniref:TetR family transcriptional regulator n=1 Tax=Actinomadura physcomitrii TaxID=2650748 RepID=A0A6I4MCD0_9ACTN|nr:TetR/AcrR family transcriptional regulator [Actinomadura physcomitrii]MWA01924.1 TetR family transcriptional regulator [Actinomadura physcomitrii]